VLCTLQLWFKGSFSPDADDFYIVAVETVNNAEWCHDYFPQIFDNAFRHNATAFREIVKPFNSGNDFLNSPIAYLRNLLLIAVPSAHSFKIIKCRNSKRNDSFSRHDYLLSSSRFLTSARLISRSSSISINP